MQLENVWYWARYMQSLGLVPISLWRRMYLQRWGKLRTDKVWFLTNFHNSLCIEEIDRSLRIIVEYARRIVDRVPLIISRICHRRLIPFHPLNKGLLWVVILVNDHCCIWRCALLHDSRGIVYYSICMQYRDWALIYSDGRIVCCSIGVLAWYRTRHKNLWTGDILLGIMAGAWTWCPWSSSLSLERSCGNCIHRLVGSRGTDRWSVTFITSTGSANCQASLTDGFCFIALDATLWIDIS